MEEKKSILGLCDFVNHFINKHLRNIVKLLTSTFINLRFPQKFQKKFYLGVQFCVSFFKLGSEMKNDFVLE